MPRKTKVQDGSAPTEDRPQESSTDMITDSSNSSTSGTAGLADSAKQATDQAKDAASKMFDQAKGQAASRADQQRQSMASGFQTVAQAFRSMGDNLRGSEQSPVTQYASEIGHAMGGQVERLGNYLQGRDVRQILTDTETFARRSPAVFLGGAFVIGLAVSRFLKSSGPQGSGPAPDFLANMPDPQRALPPASASGTIDGAPLGNPTSGDAAGPEGSI
jgi:hypothetical protein